MINLDVEKYYEYTLLLQDHSVRSVYGWQICVHHTFYLSAKKKKRHHVYLIISSLIKLSTDCMPLEEEI